MDNASIINPADFSIVEQFTVLMNGRCCESTTTMNEPRLEYNIDYDAIQPSEAAIRQLVCCAVFQAGYVCAQALATRPILPSTSDWEWKQSHQGWELMMGRLSLSCRRW